MPRFAWVIVLDSVLGTTRSTGNRCPALLRFSVSLTWVNSPRLIALALSA
jgi:hypothetical protein